MCRNMWSRNVLLRFSCSLIAFMVLVGVANTAFAQPGVGISVTLGTSQVVGQTGKTGSIQLTNAHFPPQTDETVSVLVFNPSCKTVNDGISPCPAGQGDTGVFSISATGAGRSGTDCAAQVFNLAAPDGNGTILVTSPAPIVLHANAAVQCVIDFTFAVVKLPTADCNNPPLGGLQTCSGAFVSVNNVAGEPASAAASPQTTFPLSCTAGVDKEISCDNGTTWHDPDFNNTGGITDTCQGVAGTSTIKVRYRIQNVAGGATTNTAPITACNNLTESNASFGAPSISVPGLPLAAGATGDFFGASASGLLCQSAAAGEPDSAAVGCSCTVAGVTVQATEVSDSATMSCRQPTCSVQVDKQVSCDNGVNFVDVGFPDDGTLGCSALIGQQTIKIRYQAINTGEVPATCTLNDVNSTPTVLLAAQSIGTIPAGETTALIPNPGTGTGQPFNTCNPAWSAGEPNTATLNCTCPVAGSPDLIASDTDSARIDCNPPEFAANKTCEIVTGTTSFDARVNITNGSGATLSCNITDNFYSNATGNVSCANIGAGTANPLTLVPGNPVIVPGPANTVTTASGLIPAQQFDVCNRAVVTCTSGGLEFPNNTKTVTADCPVPPQVSGCTSRTPGYWGTHPENTQNVLNFNGGSISVCGATLDKTVAAVNGSTTEDLCENNQDARAHSTSPQQLQLIRQCTSAALNVVLSHTGGQNCENANDSATLTNDLKNCCGVTTADLFNGLPSSGGLCVSSASGSAIGASGCIDRLDAFNNRFDNQSFPPGTLSDIRATPAQCQAANGNGFINTRSGLGPK